MEPDYSNYTKVELKQALECIDQVSFPDRVAYIKKELAKYPSDKTESNNSNCPDFETSLRNRLIQFGIVTAVIFIPFVATKYLGLPMLISKMVFLVVWLALVLYFIVKVVAKFRGG